MDACVRAYLCTYVCACGLSACLTVSPLSWLFACLRICARTRSYRRLRYKGEDEATDRKANSRGGRERRVEKGARKTIM